MDKNYAAYCGLYCQNCPTKAKVEPAAQALHDEMKKAHFGEFIHFIPDGEAFWRFLKSMAEDESFGSCRGGCGSPDCSMRLCAREKGVEMCALCESYPCGHFTEFLAAYPILKRDNELMREKGLEAWARLQDERRAQDYTYPDEKA